MASLTLGEISAGQDDIFKELQDRPATQPQLPPAPVDSERDKVAMR